MLKACILGYGNIATAHKKGYDALDNVELVGVCDIRKERRDMAEACGIAAYSDMLVMLEEQKPDFVDICLPTFLHAEYAVRLLDMGYNVLCEKPMGRNMDECRAMLDAAARNNKHLMIGMCLRYNGYYDALKRIATGGEYGRVISGSMYRVSPLPAWGWDDWFADGDKSGGVLLDMSIHDIDICRYIFGEPERVFAACEHTAMRYGTSHSELIYQDKVISVLGDWALAPSMPFEAGFKFNFEKATVTLDGKELKVYTETEIRTIDVNSRSHMVNEIAHFAAVLEGKATADPHDSAKSIELVLRLKESADKGEVICR